MPKIRKPCGAEEEYSQARLEQSIRSAGAPPDVADRISRKIKATDGMTADAVRHDVAKELHAVDQKLAEAYLRSENLITRTSSALPAGEAEISNIVMQRLMAMPGQKAVLYVGKRMADVKVHPRDAVPMTEIRLSKVDIDRLGTRDGARATVSFQG